MDTRLTKLIKFAGTVRTTEIFNYLEENDLTAELLNVINDDCKLFSFGVNYGILEIVKYLYECKNYEYDYDIIVNYNGEICSAIDSGQTTSISEPTLTKLTSNDTMRFEYWGKFSHQKINCINYLIAMKKKSMMKFGAKKFYYKLNPKYIVCC